jgi:hypothetical protein
MVLVWIAAMIIVALTSYGFGYFRGLGEGFAGGIESCREIQVYGQIMSGYMDTDTEPDVPDEQRWDCG